jgi:hypothetical protein
MNRSLLATLSTLSLISACSSGNGFSEDQGDNNNGGNNNNTGEITSANAVQVTKVTYQSAQATGSAGEYSGGTGLISSAPATVAKIDGSFLTSSKPSSSNASIPIPPAVEECPAGGTMTLSGDIADPLTPTLTPGDFFNLVYVACDDGFAVVDGNLFYEVDAFSNDSDLLAGTYDLSMSATFTDFQIMTADDTLLSNGDVTVRLNTLAAPIVLTETSGASLTVDGDLGSQTLTSFASSFSQDTGVQPSPYTQSSSGTLSTTLLSGVVSYTTPVEFAGFDADYPGTGEFLVTGATSSARLVVVDNVNINIEVDSDGDGVVDDTIVTTWAEFAAL